MISEKEVNSIMSIKKLVEKDSMSLTVQERMEIFSKSVIIAKAQSGRWIEDIERHLVEKLKKLKTEQNGAMSIEVVITEVILGIIGLVIIGSVLISMWPVAMGINGSVAALTQTDIATTIFKAIWPYLLLGLIAGICIALLVHYFKREQ